MERYGGSDRQGLTASNVVRRDRRPVALDLQTPDAAEQGYAARSGALPKVVAPALGKHVELGRPLHAFDVVTVAGIEARDLGHPEAAWVAAQLDDRIACLDLSLAGDREVEAEESALEKLGHELVAAHLDPELEAGKPRLGHDELGGSDPVTVADADALVEETLGGQVLAERTRAELELWSLTRPELVELGWVGVDRFVQTAVDA